MAILEKEAWNGREKAARGFWGSGNVRVLHLSGGYMSRLTLGSFTNVHYDLGSFLNVCYTLIFEYSIFLKVITIQCDSCNYPQTLFYFMYLHDSYRPERLSDFPKLTQVVNGRPSEPRF